MQSQGLSAMSGFIPPILSDSPPPLDDRIDDNDDDDGFGDFRVATDLAFDLSDSSVGRDSPDVWNTPSSNSELSDPKKEKIPVPSEDQSDIVDAEAISSRLEENKANDRLEDSEAIANRQDSEVKCRVDNSTDNSIETVQVQPTDDILPDLEFDSPEDIEELERISCTLDSPKVVEEDQCSFDIDARTSPEGADAESAEESKFSFTPLANELKTPTGKESVFAEESELAFSPEALKFPTARESVFEEESNFASSPDVLKFPTARGNVLEEESWVPHPPEELKVPISKGSVLADESGFSFPPEEVNILNEVKESLSLPSEPDDFSDFADFSSQPFHEPSAQPTISDETRQVAESAQCENSSTTIPPFEDDDFEDFDDFESAAPPIPTSPAAVTQVPEIDRSSRLAAIFDSPAEEPADDVSEEVHLQLTGCLNSCLDDSSSVWGSLKDLETSHALALQWTASSANTRLLTTLGVDSRNILIGPRWNSSMPRFAANMGTTPLEPVKAPPDKPSLPLPVPPVPSPPQQVLSPPAEEVVPAAQFDWNSSGLTNPLDCVEKEETSVIPGKSPPVIKKSKKTQVDEMWPLPPMPATDILLPSPAPPVLSPMDNLHSSLNKAYVESPDDWLNDITEVVQKTDMLTISSHLENLRSEDEDIRIGPSIAEEDIRVEAKIVEDARVEPKISDLSRIGPEDGRMISDELTKIAEESRTNGMSVEARRVVDAFPDLSFLSARKLLYAANQNMTRFQAPARP